MSSCHCLQCDLIILKTSNAKPFNEPASLLVDKGTDEVETVSEWFLVEDQMGFENVAFTRESKTLPNGLRLLTCAGCERGIIGKAIPSGEGPDIKMQSHLAKSRVTMK